MICFDTIHTPYFGISTNMILFNFFHVFWLNFFYCYCCCNITSVETVNGFCLPWQMYWLPLFYAPTTEKYAIKFIIIWLLLHHSSNNNMRSLFFFFSSLLIVCPPLSLLSILYNNKWNIGANLLCIFIHSFIHSITFTLSVCVCVCFVVIYLPSVHKIDIIWHIMS